MYWEAAGVVVGRQAERECAVGVQPRSGTRSPQGGPEAARNWLLPAEWSLGLQGRLSPEVGVSLKKQSAFWPFCSRKGVTSFQEV